MPENDKLVREIRSWFSLFNMQVSGLLRELKSDPNTLARKSWNFDVIPTSLKKMNELIQSQESKKIRSFLENEYNKIAGALISKLEEYAKENPNDGKNVQSIDRLKSYLKEKKLYGAALCGGADNPDEISNYPFVNKKMGKHELTSGLTKLLKNVKSVFDEVNKVGEAIFTARSGDPNKAIDYVGDALVYILDKTGVTPTTEEGYYKEFYNSKVPSNLSQLFGALQPFQYYDTAFVVAEDKAGQWQTTGRSPVDIANEVKIHPYWRFDKDFGIWYMEKKPDENYPFMVYPKNGIPPSENYEMWWWRGSFIQSLPQFDGVLEYPDGITEKYTRRNYEVQKPKLMKVINKLYEITNEERQTLIKSYDLLEENIIAQVSNMYVKETETDPAKFIPDWDKMSKEERQTYAKISQFKPAPEKSIPQIDYYATIKGDIKDRGDKMRGEFEFTPITGRDNWNVLWKRGYKKYVDFIESNEGKKQIAEVLKSKYALKIEERESEAIKEETKAEIEKKGEEKAAMLEKKGIKQEAAKPAEVKETLSDAEIRLEEIDNELKSDPTNEDLKQERADLQALLRNVGGWSTKNIEEGKNEREEIEYQKKYHNILKKEIDKNNQAIREGLTQKDYTGDAMPQLSKQEILSNLPFGPESLAGLTTEQRSLKHDEIFKSPILQHIRDPKEKWRVYDIIREALGLEKDKGIELSRGLPVAVDSTALRSMKELKKQKEIKKDVWDKEAYDRAIIELEGIEAKREEIKGRLSRAEQKQKEALQKTKDDLDAKYEELKKQIEELKALKGKAKGRPTLMKMGGADEPKEEPKEGEKKKESTFMEKVEKTYKKTGEIASKVDKAIAIVDKVDSIAGKVDKFIDRITPADGPQKRIIKEETRKDTELQKQAEYLIENYDDLEEEERIKQYLALEELADKKAKEAADKLEREQNIKAKDEAQMKADEEKAKKRAQAKERLSKHIVGGESSFEDKLNKAKKGVDIAEKIVDQLDKFGPKLDGRTLKGSTEEKGQKSKFSRGEAKPDSKADLDIFKTVLNELRSKYQDFSPKVASLLIKNYKKLYLDKYKQSPFDSKTEEKILINKVKESWKMKPKEPIRKEISASELKGNANPQIAKIREIIKKYIKPSLTGAKQALITAKVLSSILKWIIGKPEDDKKLEEKIKEELGDNAKPEEEIPIIPMEEIQCAAKKVDDAQLKEYADTCDKKKLGVLTLKLIPRTNTGCKEEAKTKMEKLRVLSKECKKPTKGGAKPNKWLDHVKEVKKANPSLPYKEILIMAKKSYTK